MRVGVSIDSLVKKKPSGTLAKPDTMRNSSKKEEKGAAKGFMRRQGESIASLPDLPGLTPESSQSPAPASLIVHNDLIHAWMPTQKRSCLRGAEDPEFCLGKPALDLGKQRGRQNDVAEKAGLNYEYLFRLIHKPSTFSNQPSTSALQNNSPA
jgi:hypothetical protein